MNTTEYEKHEQFMHEFSKLRVQQLYDFNDPNYVWYRPEIDPTADAYITLIPYKPGIIIRGRVISLYIPAYIDKITLCNTSYKNMADCTAIDIYISTPQVKDIPLETILSQMRSVPFNNTIEQIELMLHHTRNIPCTGVPSQECYNIYDNSPIMGYTRVMLGEPFFDNLDSTWVFQDVNYIFYAETINLHPEITCRKILRTNFNNECMYVDNLFGSDSIINSKSSRKIIHTECTDYNLTLYECEILCDLNDKIHHLVYSR